MKHLLAMLGLGLGLVAPLHAELERASLMRAGASVLKVEVLRQQGGYALGSGVVVGDGLVVTNCHVTRGGVGVHVLRGDQRWPARAQAIDAEHDLCLLRVPGLAVDSVALGRASALKTGQSVTAVGYTGGLGVQTSSGAVVALHRHDGGHVIQTDNWFSSGASGGALFDDHLHLVGVLTFRLRGGAAHYFAAPVEWLRPMIEGSLEFHALAPGKDAPVPLATPYWQREPDLQPNFLQAAALERDSKWPELEALAVRWSLAVADDAAPWAAQALALARQGRLAEAGRALEQSLAIEPHSGAAWLQLGRLYLRQGANERALEVRRRLEALDPARASELDVPAETI